jgi:hypothetical protein
MLLITSPSVDLGTAGRSGLEHPDGQHVDEPANEPEQRGHRAGGGQYLERDVQGADANGHYATPTLKTGRPAAARATKSAMQVC